MQSYYVEDGDYVKLDNINVGYTFNLKNKKSFNVFVYM